MKWLTDDEFFGTEVGTGVEDRALDTISAIAQNTLSSWATSPDFLAKMQIAFGNSFDVEKAVKLASAWAQGDFSDFPEIEIRSEAEINGALGAFAAATGKIYLSREFLAKNAGNVTAVAGVLLEEFGHFVDSQINSVDAIGDEGEIFSDLVQGKALSQGELAGLKGEDDSAVVVLDGEVRAIEQATVSDSGGFKGSEKTIEFGSKDGKGGGTVQYSYEMFRIQDSLKIIYEGKEIVNTGFVSGSTTQRINVPKGNSDQLQVILTTNDEDTQWNYTVDTTPCPDPLPFEVVAVSGQPEEKDGKCVINGIINIGREGFGPMLKVEGRVEYDKNTISVDGVVSSLIGNVTEPLFQGEFNLDVKTGSTTSLTDIKGTLANEYKPGGVIDIDFNGLTLNPNEIALKGAFTLPTDLGGQSVTLDGVANSLFIDTNGPRFGGGGKVSLPSGRFLLFKKLGIETTDWDIEYIPSEKNTLKIQGKATLKPFFKLLKGTEIGADLSGNNFIQLKDNQPIEIKGALSIKNNFKLPGGWGLKEIGLTYESSKQEFGIKAKGSFPFAPRSLIPSGQQQVGPGFGLEGSFIFPPFELDSIGAELDNLNKPIGSGFFWQRVAGKIENFSEADTDPIEFSGGVGFTLGPKVQIPIPDIFLRQIGFPPTIEGAAGDLQLDGTVSSDRAVGKAKLTFVNDLIANIQGSAEYNWKKDNAKVEGSFGLLGNIFNGQGQITIDTNTGNAYGAGQLKGKFPDSKFAGILRNRELASIQAQIQYRNNSSTSDDFINFWGKINIPFANIGLANVPLIDVGKRFYYLEGRTENLGKELPQTNSFTVDSGTKWSLLSADWDNPSIGNVQVRVKTPNGNFIEEADFAANNIAIVDDLTSPQSRTVVVANPSPGVWDIELVNPTGLGEVQYSAFRDSVAPTIQITDPATDVSGGNVAINYNAFDADSNAKVSLFYDTDNQGFDGIQIVDNLEEKDGAGNFAWNTEGVPNGDYYIYAMAMDENNAPVFSYSTGRVRVTETADLSVTKTANADPVVIGNNLTYTITVTNNGSNNARGVTLTDTLPEGVKLVSASVNPNQQSDNDLIFDLGDIANGTSKTVNITITPPTSGTITGTASVTSKTFDPDVANDTDILATTVSTPTVDVASTDLAVTTTNTPAPLNLGDKVTYNLAVTNNSPTKATGVKLTNSLPSGLKEILITPSKGSVLEGNEVFTANLGELNSGETATIAINATSIAAGDLINTASITSNETDSNSSNNFITQTLTVNPVDPAPVDLELTKTVSNSNPNVGDQITFTLTLTNKGPGIASSIKVADILPPGLSFISANSIQGTYDSNTGIWDVGNMRDNLTRTLNISAQVNTPGSIITNATLLSLGETDLNPGNNQASLTINTIGSNGSIPNQKAPILGTPGNDNLVGTFEPDLIYALAGNDTISGIGESDTIYGNEGDDFINGNVTNDLIIGGKGNDILLGGKGNDQIYGDVGNDTLIGGFGQDILVSGPDVDTFVLPTKAAVVNDFLGDIIRDFQVGTDKIGLTDGLTFSNLILVSVENKTVIQIAENRQTLGVVDGVLPNQLSNSFVSVNLAGI